MSNASGARMSHAPGAKLIRAREVDLANESRPRGETHSGDELRPIVA